MSDSKEGISGWLRRLGSAIALMAMTVVFGARGVVDCADHSTNPAAVNEGCRAGDTDLCTAAAAGAGNVKAKHGLTNRMLWKWANGTVVAFDVADHRAFFDWGLQPCHAQHPLDQQERAGPVLDTDRVLLHRVRVWSTETCDRSGGDTCLFRREGDAKVSFSHGVAFNRHLISCLGTRINWDGSHTRNTWAGDCSGASAATAATAKVGAGELTIGRGRSAVSVGRYLARGQIDALDRACIVIASTSKPKCRRVALRLYRSLPDPVQAKLANQVGQL